MSEQPPDWARDATWKLEALAIKITAETIERIGQITPPVWRMLLLKEVAKRIQAEVPND